MGPRVATKRGAGVAGTSHGSSKVGRNTAGCTMIGAPRTKWRDGLRKL